MCNYYCHGSCNDKCISCSHDCGSWDCNGACVNQGWIIGCTDCSGQGTNSKGGCSDSCQGGCVNGGCSGTNKKEPTSVKIIVGKN